MERLYLWCATEQKMKLLFDSAKILLKLYSIFSRKTSFILINELPFVLYLTILSSFSFPQ